ncbi:ricin-type beta-trefoil lectin domain protein [Streptomyces sp. TRM70350]|uniref:poly(ethylene terephthalate) hydrolase family protein n=1 Tax=Streptomyces sp. TRM70350 TaxID=2856165 RepID=UPI001C488E9A|nr:ricin-type beta-trefoil lectin domain protein [Streptomyces sp. TRM70350]MBV7699836.1 ricin-type beta-trefoil lectin domain protein [Streptomyces sp. TRM70350]
MVKRIGFAAAIGLVILAVVAPGSAPAAESPYQRGPDPTRESVAASRGTFATAEVSVPAGNGFGGGVIYYPTDTSQGTFGGVAIVPGYTATWAAEGAWMGHWLASFGFVVIGIDTINRNDWDTARGTQLLAALDYLTQRSSVRNRVDANRLAVMGHSMGGGGAMHAALQRPSLKAAIGLAPFSPSQNLTNMRVPTLLVAGQNDTTTTPTSILNLYNGIPATTEKAYLELTGAGHGFPTSANSVMTRKVIPWLKIFVDHDTRYHQFLCPLLDWTGITAYRSSCPLNPPGGPTGSTFSLVGADSGKCVDVPGASRTNGTGLITYTCNGASNQRWTQTAANELRIYDNSKCMEAGTSAGSRAVITSCTGGNGQKWTFNANGTITHAQSGLCLYVNGGSTANQAAVIVWTCHGGSNQVWTRQP